MIIDFKEFLVEIYVNNIIIKINENCIDISQGKTPINFLDMGSF